MFEDLRKSANENAENPEQPVVQETFDPYDYSEHDEEQTQKQFLGMSSFQRFILALMLLVMVCVLSGFLLILTGKVYLPFL
jgi:hypothetical protein